MGVRFFGQFLIDEGEIDEIQLAAALAELDEVNLEVGGLAAQAGYLSEQAAAHINAQQRKRDLPFGELAVELGLLTPDQVDELLFRQAGLHALLGETLVKRGDLDPTRLAGLVDRFKVEQAYYADALQSLPMALQDEPFFEDVLDLVCNLAQRVARLRVKLAPTQEWQGGTVFPIRVRVEAELEHTVRLGIAASRGFGRALAAGMLRCSPDACEIQPVETAVAGFLELVAGNAKAGLTDRDQFNRIGSPEHGCLPSAGFAATLVSTHGDALLIMEPG